ncbi:MAG TPA: hypothetical protein VHZ52_10570 [Acidobacteriaceae bacterium]|jgi:hypothetical protein|nr:hypothetical protein [Acidobacteriaceae bacterium]
MLRKEPVLLTFLFVAIFVAPQAYSQSHSIHDKIQQTYSFEPHALSHAEQQAKSAVLDKFWSEAKAQRAEYIQPLRAELADFHNPPFFLYDGSMLLQSLSDTHEDRQIELAAMAHCDLRDVQQREYFLQVHKLATLGEDTTAAALHVLEDPNFKVFIPQHALTLGQDFVLIYLLLPTDQHFWEEATIHRVAVEKDPTAQKSLLTLLWYAQTPAADKAIAAFVVDTSKPADNRKMAKEMTQRAGMGSKLAMAIFTIGSAEGDLRKKRQERMKSVSDEALYDLDKYTMEIHAKRK